MKENNEKKIYIRPEDVCELILEKIQVWKTPEIMKENISKILWYLKNENYINVNVYYNFDIYGTQGTKDNLCDGR